MRMGQENQSNYQEIWYGNGVYLAKNLIIYILLESHERNKKEKTKQVTWRW